jgi:hypothetical protein
MLKHSHVHENELGWALVLAELNACMVKEKGLTKPRASTHSKCYDCPFTNTVLNYQDLYFNRHQAN